MLGLRFIFAIAFIGLLHWIDFLFHLIVTFVK